MKKTLLSALIAASSFSAMAYDVNTMSWEQIEAQAKEEGSVTFSVWYLQPAWRKFVKPFEEQTGIKVRIPEGTHDGNRNKLQAESRRDKGSMDIVALGPTALKTFKVDSTLMPLTVLPEFNKLNKSAEGVDSQGYGVTFWGNQTGIAYDSGRISESELPQTFNDIEKYIASNPMNFGVNDPNGGGAGQRFIEATIRHVNGDFEMTEKVDSKVVKSWAETWDWYQGNKQDILITASNADSLTRINDGEIIMAPAWEDHLAGLQKRGALTDRIKFYIPEFGMSGGGNFVTIAKNSQHKAASLVFINWLTSAETQSAINAEFGSAPQHPDADSSNSLLPQEMRANATVPFNSEYSAVLKKQFTRNVLMR
ncbi:extracellular solute-binding protein [Vibrio ouci]|uniref:Extracellular solute-binding protein n=1 Tax=Vibrio ouci TaxID=2499078 RepID=A0A4Y8WCV6_9VIBR|nr:extracellular solute-binding protein [Vibrio ouci]TFH90425.1 extracellular solute-binding protein [Vibrio ouci]